MATVTTAALLALLLAQSYASSPLVRLDDTVCALQTTLQTQGPRGGGGPGEGPAPPRRGDDGGSQLLRVEEPRGSPPRSPCSTTGHLHTFNVSVEQTPVSGGARFTYTLVPTPAPSDAAGISHIEFLFGLCTCQDPNKFSNLEMLEFEESSSSSISINEECGPAGSASKTHLTFNGVGNKKGHIYIVSYTVSHTYMFTGAVPMKILAGATEYVDSSICGPICLPESLKPPATSSPAATGSPTSSPTATGSPTPSPPSTDPPAPPPVASPKSPTYDAAVSFGDPHVSNLKGERFDILQPNYHTFLLVPRGADEESSMLRVLAKVDPLGPLCGGLYVTGLKFSGSWLGEVGSLELLTNVSAAMDAASAIQIKVGSSLSLSISEFRLAVNPAVVSEVTELHPEEPGAVNQHVDTLRVKIRLGPAIAKVRMVYQKEKTGFSNSLWLSTTGLKYVEDVIGGILGFDDHAAAATPPTECEDSATGGGSEEGGASGLLSPRVHHSVHAEAIYEEDIE